MKNFIVFLVSLIMLFSVGCSGTQTTNTDMTSLGLELTHIQMLDNENYTPEEALSFTNEMRFYLAQAENITPNMFIKMLISKMEGPKGAAMLVVIEKRLGKLDWDMDLPMGDLELDAIYSELDSLDEISTLFMM